MIGLSFRIIAIVAAGIGVASAGRALAPQSAATYLSSAENRFRNGDLDGAMADVTQAINLDPTNARAFLYRGFMRLRKNHPDGAITDFTQAITLAPKFAGHYAFRAAAKNLKGDSDGAIADATRAIDLDPAVTLAFKTLAFAYYEKAYDSASRAQKDEFISRGLHAADRALKLDDDFDAFEVKALFLRLQATLEPDPAKSSDLTRQVTVLKQRAERLRQERGTDASVPGASIPPPPPPPPPSPPPPQHVNPLRVGGALAPPKQIKDVRPVYPAIARSARVQGAVILEITVGVDGKVTEVVVLRSMPLLDAAAIDAVRQWEYEPTLLNGIPVPVIATVTVDFTLK